MATVSDLVARGAFVIDPRHRRVHRSSTLKEACAREIPASTASFRDTMLDATLVMKTRHYLPCPRCWGSEEA
ncbi:MAG TPA: hypothetical protein VM889_09575 [Candidatus Thermoplasmatota archaeon]|nr:hypothetical protein [Candidatus Thermoplasmatota archaeon]